MYNIFIDILLKLRKVIVIL